MNKITNQLKSFFKPINIFILVVALLGAFVLFPIYFEAMIYPLPSTTNDMWKSLDPSWLLRMNFAVNNNFVFGKDIVYTYGPLAYLSTKVGWGQSRICFLLYDFFITLNYFLLFFMTLKISKNKITTILIFAAFIVVFPVWVGSDNAVILMGLLVFWIRISLDKPQWNYYVFQTLILGLIFFIKFNTGLIAFPLFMSGIAYNLIVNWKDKKQVLKLIIILFIPFILIIVFSKILNVDIPPYIYYGLEMVSGYNEIMYLDHDSKTRSLALAIIVLSSSVLIYKTIIDKKELLKNLTILFLFGTSMFVLYKQGFVRGMEIDFFIFSILIIISIYDLHVINYKKISSVLILVCISISFYFVLFKENNQSNILQKLNKLYFIQYERFTNDSGMLIFPNNNQLPQSVKDKIGNSTVDVYPWNLQMLWENKLNCAPRPAFQSHSTYTKDLEELNFQHYNSFITAPEFVIYEFTSIDSRYPLFDEPKLNLVLSKNYSLAEEFTFENRKILLLQKNKVFRPLKLEKTKEYAMLLNSPLVVKEGIYYEIQLYNNAFGKVKSIIDHSPGIMLEIYGNQSNPYQFKTSNTLLQSGLFCDNYFSDTISFENYITNNKAGLEKIRYYNFKPIDSNYFNKKIKITEYKITQ